MLSNRTFILFAAVLLLVAGVAEARPGRGNGNGRGPRPKPREAKAEGTITALTTAPQTVTIAGVTLNVTPSTKIEVDDDHAPFSALAVGQEAEAKYDPVTRNASKIEVEDEDDGDDDDEQEIIGRIITADPTLGLVTLNTDADPDAEFSFSVTPQTELKLGHLRLLPGELGLLSGLLAKVEFTGAPGSLVAHEIEASTQGALSATGQIVSVGGSTLTIQTAPGAAPLVLHVPADLDIKVKGQTLPLSSLQPGHIVRVHYLPTGLDQGIALQIDVTPPPPPTPQSFHGELIGVDAGAGTLTVALHHGGTLAVVVNSLTDLRLNGKRVSLSQLVTVLNEAAADQRHIKVSGQYVVQSGVNVATQIRATQTGGRGRGRGRGRGHE